MISGFDKNPIQCIQSPPIIASHRNVFNDKENMPHQNIIISSLEYPDGSVYGNQSTSILGFSSSLGLGRVVRQFSKDDFRQLKLDDIPPQQERKLFKFSSLKQLDHHEHKGVRVRGSTFKFRILTPFRFHHYPQVETYYDVKIRTSGIHRSQKLSVMKLISKLLKHVSSYNLVQ